MRELLLALLVTGPAHGYELKLAAEATLGAAAAPINIGQIYTTLQRMLRDGLVSVLPVMQDGKPDKKVHVLTEAGQAALVAWLDAPLGAPRLRGRDDVYTRILVAAQPAVAALLPGGVGTLIAHQRRDTLLQVRDLTQRLNAAPPGSPAALLLEGALLQLEGELRWLDLCDAHLT